MRKLLPLMFALLLPLAACGDGTGVSETLLQIRGVVTDSATGAPIPAGISFGRQGFGGGVPLVSTTAGEDGHYSLGYRAENGAAACAGTRYYVAAFTGNHTVVFKDVRCTEELQVIDFQLQPTR